MYGSVVFFSQKSAYEISPSLVGSDVCFFFQAEDGIRDRSPSRGLGDVYKRQLLSSQEGIIIRLHANEIPVQSRYGSGVRVMRLGENDKVMVLARTDHDDEAQTESIESDAEDEPTAEQLAEMEAADEASAAEAPEADTGDEE